MRAVVLVLVAAALGACEREPTNRREPAHEVERARRVIEPPAGIVRPLPPFLISSAGVGPYRLSDRLSDLLQQLPTGPRIATLDIPNILYRSLIRFEQDSILVGGEPQGTATFVAVLDAQVARTESGLHVGSTREDVKKLGPPLEELNRAHDPRLEFLANPRGARVVFDPDRKTDRVAAIVVTTEVPPAARTTNEAGCPRPVPAATTIEEVGTLFGACFTGSGPGELVQVDGSDISIRGAGSDKLLAPLRLNQKVVFAAPLRVDGRDELVVITHDDEPQTRTWSVVAYRFEAGKMIKTADQELYSLSATNARWIGVELAEIDLYLELAAGNDVIEVGGLLTTRADLPDAKAPWRDVVVISPVSVQRRHEKPAKANPPASEGSASGSAVDAGVETTHPTPE
ncbi:MAG: hypothetical protein AB7T06_20055 [Kofleriaceae bacterium]